MAKKLPLNTMMLNALRDAVKCSGGFIRFGDRCTKKALVHRGLAFEDGLNFRITAQGRARARFAADVVSKSECRQAPDPSLMKDL
jgi:hypothetical protein